MINVLYLCWLYSPQGNFPFTWHLRWLISCWSLDLHFFLENMSNSLKPWKYTLNTNLWCRWVILLLLKVNSNLKLNTKLSLEETWAHITSHTIYWTELYIIIDCDVLVHHFKNYDMILAEPSIVRIPYCALFSSSSSDWRKC